MTGAVRAGLGMLLAGAALTTASAAWAATPGLEGSFPIVELRQYMLHDGKRDVLIDLFEREFIESQEVLGYKIVGTFRDLDRPNYFVWVRAFRDMDSRLAGLSGFYGGPVWKAHREAANATMIDSDNVFLLHAPSEAAEFKTTSPRPALGESAPAGLVIATIYYLKGAPADAVPVFEERVKPQLEKAGAAPVAWFIPETASNNFRLPIREGERVLVWFARLSSADDYAARKGAIEAAAAPLAPFLSRSEALRLQPTSRSQLR